MRPIEAILGLIALGYVMLYVKDQYNEVEYVVASTDGRSYLVRNLPDKQQAADLLASVNKDLQALIAHLVKTYPQNQDVQRLQRNYNPDSLSEGGDTANYTSYSVNKGEQIVFCLRSRDGKNRLVKKNVMMYVAVHELAHLMTKEVGHTQTFWDNFKFILQEAVKIGIYTKVDYAAKPVSYCGIRITSSVI